MLVGPGDPVLTEAVERGEDQGALLDGVHGAAIPPIRLADARVVGAPRNSYRRDQAAAAGRRAPRQRGPSRRRRPSCPCAASEQAPVADRCCIRIACPCAPRLGDTTSIWPLNISDRPGLSWVPGASRRAEVAHRNAIPARSIGCPETSSRASSPTSVQNPAASSRRARYRRSATSSRGGSSMACRAFVSNPIRSESSATSSGRRWLISPTAVRSSGVRLRRSPRARASGERSRERRSRWWLRERRSRRAGSRGDGSG